MTKDKELKKTQAYTLSPVNIAWLRQCAARQTTADKSISASAILDSILNEARTKDAIQLPLPIQSQEKKRIASSVPVAA